jgi:hypothetical protein
MSSRRQQILEALQTRAEAIRTARGFATDAGLSVFLGGAPALGLDDPETAIAIVVFEDAPKAQGKKLFIGFSVGVCAIAKADLDAPWVSIETILGDIKTAIELEDRTLGGLLLTPMERGSTRTIDRETGSTTVGAMVTYNLAYTETWGQP